MSGRNRLKENKIWHFKKKRQRCKKLVRRICISIRIKLAHSPYRSLLFAEWPFVYKTSFVGINKVTMMQTWPNFALMHSYGLLQFVLPLSFVSSAWCTARFKGFRVKETTSSLFNLNFTLQKYGHSRFLEEPKTLFWYQTLKLFGKTL